MPEFIENKTCLMCGGPIPWRAGRKARDRAKFCGNEHKFQWQRVPENGPNYRGTKRTATCKVPDCGKEFDYYPSVRPNAEACSDEHRHILHALKMTGRRPSNGVYANASSFRAMARHHFYDRCAICAWPLREVLYPYPAFPGVSCDVCHIVARKNGGTDTLDNVVLLCPNHHRLFDLGLIPVEKIRQARANALRIAGPVPSVRTSRREGNLQS